jgi:hypothetical protein
MSMLFFFFSLNSTQCVFYTLTDTKAMSPEKSSRTVMHFFLQLRLTNRKTSHRTAGKERQPLSFQLHLGPRSSFKADPTLFPSLLPAHVLATLLILPFGGCLSTGRIA